MGFFVQVNEGGWLDPVLKIVIVKGKQRVH